MTSPASIHLIHATAASPGAIAILHLIGGDCETLLHSLTGVRNWPLQRMRLVDLAGIDEGLVVRLSPDVTQIMPHGGPRVVQRLTAKLIELGATIADVDDVDPQSLYPEAQDRIEALMMLTLSRASSPLAIDLLLQQTERWRCLHRDRATLTDVDITRSQRLNRLVNPPLVVLAGEPNVGKSTLSNALFGRAMSIAADVPGTTRDYVAGRIELVGVVVDWHDTPGLRPNADVIESRAIAIARKLMLRADLLIAMRDAEHDWPVLPRPADCFVMNKVDDAPETAPTAAGDAPASPIRISARQARGIARLISRLRDRLVPPADLAHPGPWLFNQWLLESR